MEAIHEFIHPFFEKGLWKYNDILFQKFWYLLGRKVKFRDENWGDFFIIIGGAVLLMVLFHFIKKGIKKKTAKMIRGTGYTRIGNVWFYPMVFFLSAESTWFMKELIIQDHLTFLDKPVYWAEIAALLSAAVLVLKVFCHLRELGPLLAAYGFTAMMMGLWPIVYGALWSFFTGVMAFLILYCISAILAVMNESGFTGAMVWLLADMSVISDIRNKAEEEDLSEADTEAAIAVAMEIMHGDDEE